MDTIARLRKAVETLREAAGTITASQGRPVEVTTESPAGTAADASLPPDVRTFFAEVTGRLELTAAPWSGGPRPDDASPMIDAGPFGFVLGLREVSELAEEWDGFEELFESNVWSVDPPADPEDLYPVVDIGTGDLIVVATADPNEGSVYYLDHGGSDMSWVRLARSFVEYLEVIASLGGPGPSVWELQHFYRRDLDRLSLDCPEAEHWMNWHGLGGRPVDRTPLPLEVLAFDAALVAAGGLTDRTIRNEFEKVAGDGRVAVRVRNAWVGDFERGVAVYRQGEREGLIDAAGRVVFEAVRCHLTRNGDRFAGTRFKQPPFAIEVARRGS